MGRIMIQNKNSLVLRAHASLCSDIPEYADFLQRGESSWLTMNRAPASSQETKMGMGMPPVSTVVNLMAIFNLYSTSFVLTSNLQP